METAGRVPRAAGPNRSDRVEWLDPHEPTDQPCFLCNNGDGNTVILRARHGDCVVDTLDVASCGSCGSAWFPELADHLLAYPHDGEAGDPQHFRLLLDHYFDLVGGLDWKTQIVERARPSGPCRVLEVGCGSGLLLDYLRVMWEADVHGVEPSVYGEAGAERLSLPITISTLADATDLEGERFDRVICTEVLEHVPDPDAFLHTVSDALTDDGVLALTTPRASSLDPATPFGELYAALSVGGHYFLASPSKLESTANAAGLTHVSVEEFGMMNVMFASKSPLDVARPFDTESLIGDYYSDAASRPHADPRVRLSDSINAYINVRAAGQDSAVELRERSDLLLREQFAISVPSFDGTADAILRCRSIFDLGDVAPYNLAEYLYWRGRSDDLTEPERTVVWEIGGLFAATGLRVDPVAMFVGAAKLRWIVAALDGRVASPIGKQLRGQIAAIPETRDMKIADPHWRTTMTSMARSVKSRLTDRGRRPRRRQ